MYLLRYAWRNTTRNRARTLLTTFAVVVSVGLLMVGHAMLTGLQDHIVTEFAKQTGHVRVRHADYERESRFEPLEFNLHGRRALTDGLQATPGVVLAAARIHFRVMVQYTDVSTIVPESPAVDEDTLTDDQIFGRKVLEFAPAVAFEPSIERGLSRVDDRLKSGSWFTADDANEVLLGADLAKRLGVKAGDDVQIISYRKGIRDVEAHVVGIVDYGNRFANRLAHLPITVAERLLDLHDEATEIVLVGEDLEEAEALRDTLKKTGLVDGFEVSIWSEIGMARLVSAIFRVVLSILMFMIIGVAGINLLNTMMMTVLERQREIGVLLALGLARRSIVKVFLLEASAYGIVGASLGVVFGGAVSFYLAETGIRLGESTTRKMLIPVSNVIQAVPTLEGLVWAVSVGLFVVLFGAFWPAMRASRVLPIEAMRRGK